MKGFMVRPALVPVAVAVALPVAFARVSVLGAVLSLLVSALLMVLSVQIGREQRRAKEMTARGDLYLSWARGAACSEPGGDR